ncbi:hypothetical protein C3E98_021420 [Pseudomonas sp. MWU13-2625]|nr:hypothetical protein C3E98_021420 [Pseudomonas sp. MWU13-2625]
MSYSVVVEFKDTNADGKQEALISRYNNGYASNRKADVVVTAYSNSKGEYDRAEGVDDVEGNDGVDEYDTDTYTGAANLASKLAGLSSVGPGRLFSCILVTSSSEDRKVKPASVNINFFKASNTDMSKPDSTVKLNLNTTGFYKVEVPKEGEEKFSMDVDGDGDSDTDDKMILERIATFFVSMRGFSG